MALPTSSSPLRILVIAEEVLFLLLLLFSLNLAGNNSEDVGVSVNSSVRSPLYALRGRPFNVRCPVRLRSDRLRVLDLWWTKDGVRVGLNDRISINPDGSLHFEKIQHKAGPSRHRNNSSDEGAYRCFLKFHDGVVASSTIQLFVIGVFGGEIGEDVIVTPGSSALLSCPITSSPVLATELTWLKGQKNISQEFNSRYNILYSGTLFISNVEETDGGNYSCIVHNEILKKERRGSLSLVVEGRREELGETPTFLNNLPPVLVLASDEETVLDCAAQSKQPPTISWLNFIDTPIEAGETIIGEGALVGQHRVRYARIVIAPGMSGNFTCKASNGLHSNYMSLLVYRSPVLIKGPVSVNHPAAKTVRFECSVPQPFSLSWLKDGQVLETGKGRIKTKQNELVLSNTIRNDSGFYQCEVMHGGNVYGIGTARLLIENRPNEPEAPSGITCIPDSSRSLNLSWVGTADLGFTIHWTEVDGGEERQSVSKSPFYILRDLKSFTNYAIYIRGYSGTAASPQSPTLTCSTLADVPLNVPRPLEFELVGPIGTARVRWAPLKKTEARGPITLYKVSWRRTDGNFNNVLYLNGSSTETLLTGLDEEASYEVRVLPSTPIGWPLRKELFPWTRIPKRNESMEGIDFSPPNLFLEGMNKGIRVSWDEIMSKTAKGVRISYSTYINEIGEQVSFGPFYILDHAQRNMSILNLQEGTSYEVFAQIFGDGWESIVVEKTIRTLSSNGHYDDDGQAVNILGITATPISSSAIHVTWIELTNNAASSYTVKYNQADSNEHKFITSTSGSVDVNGLAPFTLYEFAVAFGNNSPPTAPFSLKVESRTLPAKPGIPLSVSYSTNNRSIEVTWVEPSDPNGVITSYVLEYREYNKTVWERLVFNETKGTLEGIPPNVDYEVRVSAENSAGLGPFGDPVKVTIFLRKPPNTSEQSTRGEPEMKDDPATNDGFFAHQQKHLGIILGVSISVFCVLICGTIIMCRHRCFSLITRQDPSIYVNGNGHGPRNKRSLESLNCVEMKALDSLTDTHLDTKGGHPMSNGGIGGPGDDGVEDPLLMRLVRNPIDHQAENHRHDPPNFIRR